MKQLDPKAVWWFFLRYLPVFIFLSFFLGMFVSPLAIMLGGFSTVLLKQNSGISDPTTFLSFLGAYFFVYILIIIIISYVWARLSYKFYKYELTDLGFRKESGVIYKKYTTIPYDRIQNVDIYRGILARVLGLSDLQIQTAGYSVAGGMISEGRLPALSQEVAEQLRDELIKKAHQSKNQGL